MIHKIQSSVFSEIVYMHDSRNKSVRLFGGSILTPYSNQSFANENFSNKKLSFFSVNIQMYCKFNNPLSVKSSRSATKNRFVYSLEIEVQKLFLNVIPSSLPQWGSWKIEEAKIQLEFLLSWNTNTTKRNQDFEKVFIDAKI